MPKQRVWALTTAVALSMVALVAFHKPILEKITGVPRTASGHVNHGVIAFRKAELGEAIEFFQKALALQPSNAQIRYFLAQALEASGRRDEAVQSYKTVLQLEPRLVSPRFNLAVIYRLEGDYAGMEEELRKAVELAEGFAGAHLLLGTLYYDRTDWERAVTALSRALQNPSAVIGDRAPVRMMLNNALSWSAGKQLETAKPPVQPLPSTSPDTQLCQQCHRESQVNRSHARVPGGSANCLECHAPHSLKGSPSLPAPPNERCTTCHFAYASKNVSARSSREGLQVHVPVLMQTCTDCHQPHELGVPSVFTGEGPNASCATCHGKSNRQKGLTYQHGPFQQNFCDDCHNPHWSSQDALLRLPQEDLCTVCHVQTMSEQELPVQHPPFATGVCTDCHSPHASAYPRMLRISPDQLCASCHSPRKQDKAFQHAPYRDGSCTQCHSPHASRTDELLRSSSQTELCTSCHTQIDRELAFPSHHPIGEQIQCSNCHRPHTADYPALLQAQGLALCITCHPSQGMYADQAAHLRLTTSGAGGQCTICHQPHGSADSPLLTNFPVQLCRQCHQPQSDHEHPVGSTVLAPSTGQPVVCSSCHEPHGNFHAGALRRPGDGLCLSCHDR